MLGNLHTHTHFSDGSSPPEAYLDEAERLGFSVLGFSDHSPIPFPNTFAIPEGGLKDYVNVIMRIKGQGSKVKDEHTRQKIRDPEFESQHPASGTGARRSPAEPTRDPGSGIHVLLGLEYDYIPGLTQPLSNLRAEFPFDYIIGSVHLVKNSHSEPVWFIDGPNIITFDKGLQEVFGGDARRAVTAYWRQIQEMVLLEKPDIIGHLDKIKMHNHDRFFSEDDPWYIDLAEETLELIRQQGSIVEVNTRGIYKQRSDSLFPGPAILKKILSLGIPVTLTSDAHKPGELGLFFSEATEILKTIGFKFLWLLDTDGWKETSV